MEKMMRGMKNMRSEEKFAGKYDRRSKSDVRRSEECLRCRE